MIANINPPEGYCPVCMGYVVVHTVTSAAIPGTGDCLCPSSYITYEVQELEPEPELEDHKSGEHWRKKNRHRYDFANGRQKRRTGKTKANR